MNHYLYSYLLSVYSITGFATLAAIADPKFQEQPNYIGPLLLFILAPISVPLMLISLMTKIFGNKRGEL